MKPRHWAYNGGGGNSVAVFLSNIREARAKSYVHLPDDPFLRFLGETQEQKQKGLVSLMVGKNYFTKKSYLEQRDAVELDKMPIPIKTFAQKLVKRARSKQIPLVITEAEPNQLTVNHARLIGSLTKSEVQYMGAIVQAVADADNINIQIEQLKIRID